ncbi:TniQ family protein [Paraburkholderia caffeinilytica]
MPQRSALFNIPPYGCCGENREHLGSYVARLSAAHGITRGTLTSRVVGPGARELFHVTDDRMARDIGRSDYSILLAGCRQQAQIWSTTLNRLTMREDLQLCSLLPLKNLVPLLKLQNQNRRVCIECHREDEMAGRDKYDRLLWRLSAVKACPLHALQLSELPTPAKYYSRAQLAENDLEFAARAANASMKPVPASDFEIEIARLIAELLDDSTRCPELRFSASAQSRFLQHAADDFFNGKAAVLGRHFRVDKGQIFGWMRKGVRISLPRLAVIAYSCRCRIADVISGTWVAPSSLRQQPDDHQTKVLERKRNLYKAPSERKRAEVRRLLDSGEATDAADAARRLNLSYKTLREHFPTEHAQFVHDGQELRKAVSQRRRNLVNQTYLEEHLAILKTGFYPSRRLVAERMKARGLPLTEFRAAERAQVNAHAISGVPIASRGGAAPLPRSRRATNRAGV